MTIAEQVDAEIRSLPEALAREVLAFAKRLRERENGTISEDWWSVQQAALATVWDNEEDSVWDDL